MPIVILPAPGNVPTGPGPVLNNQRMPTISTAGQEQALAGLGEAMAMPMMDKSQALPYEALGAVGKAVVNAGSVMGALQEERVKAESQVQAAKIGNELKTLWAKEESWQIKNPDTTKWDAHWAESYQPLKDQINARTDLHKQAKQAITIGMIGFEGDTAIKLVENGSRTAFSQASSLADLNINDAIVAKNYTKAEELTDKAINDGYKLPSAKIKIKADIESDKKTTRLAARDADINAIETGITEENGFGAYVVLDALKQSLPDDASKSATYQSLDPDERNRAILRVESEIKRIQSDNIEGAGGVYDRIISEKEPLNEEEIEEIGIALRLPANKVEDLIEFKKKYDQSKVKDARFNQKKASALFNAIMDYKKPDDDNLDEWSKLSQRVELLGESGGETGRLTKGVLKQQLYLKHPYQIEGKSDESLPEGVGKLITSKLNEFMENAHFGQLYVQEPEMVATEKGMEIVPNSFKEKRNPAVAIKYASAYITLSAALKIEVAKNPGILTDSYALEAWMDEKLGGTKAGSSVDDLRGPKGELFPGDKLYTP